MLVIAIKNFFLGSNSILLLLAMLYNFGIVDIYIPVNRITEEFVLFFVF